MCGVDEVNKAFESPSSHDCEGWENVFNRHLQHFQMALYIAFEKEADSVIKKIVKTFAGPHVHTDMIVSQFNPKNINTAYSAYMGEGFGRVFQREFCFSNNTHDFLFIDVSPDELTRISKTCEGCVVSKKPYNTKDMVLSVLPMRRPREKNIFEAESLFCSQAMILILRSCLNQEHPLQNILWTTHSRTTTPSQLYTLLKSNCHPVESGLPFLLRC